MRKALGDMAALELVVAGAAALLFAYAAGPGGGAPNAAAVATFVVLVVAAENAAVLLPSGVRLSPAAMIVLASIVAFQGTASVLGASAVGWSAGLVWRHVRARQFRLVLFNCSQYAIAGGAAAGAYAIAGRGPAGALTSVLAAASAFAGANVGIIVLAVAAQGHGARAAWRDMSPHLPSYLAFGMLGTGVGLLYRGLGSAAVLALLSLLLVARTAYSSVIGQRRASGLVELLARCTRASDLALDEHETLVLLDDVREALNAELCEVLVRDDRSGGVFVVRLEADGETTTTRVRASERALELAVLAERGARVLSADDLDHTLRARGIENAVIATLTGAEADGGTVLVANRRAVNGGFRDADAEQLRTLAASLGSALEKRRLFQRLRWDATHDLLTGHLNRPELSRRLEEQLRVDPAASGFVLYLDVEGLKEINETYGHERGDAVLCEIARRVGELASAHALIARVGDDELVLVEPTAGSVCDHVNTVLDAVRAPIGADEVAISVGVAGGVSLFPAHGTDAQLLLKRAEAALFAAKERHTGFEEFDVASDGRAARRLALSADLRVAIERDELVVHYQPKIDLQTRQPVGCEALVRWSRPDGLVAPDAFIAVAEQTGLIRAITMSVMRKAAAECSRWRRRGHELGVAVNVSVPLLVDEKLPEAVAAVLAEASLPAEALTLEITETSLMRDASRSIAVLARLADLGVRLSIDDFGTGYSSLAYLRDLPVNEVKIDRSFVISLVSGHDAIVRLTLELAHSLGFTVVAEGVEDAPSSARLTALGCDQAQGFHFAKPMPADQLLAWLDDPTPAGVVDVRTSVGLGDGVCA